MREQTIGRWRQTNMKDIITDRKDGDEVSTEVASRYASSKALPGEALLREGSWHKEALMDQRIFLGTSSRVSAGKL